MNFLGGPPDFGSRIAIYPGEQAIEPPPAVSAADQFPYKEANDK